MNKVFIEEQRFTQWWVWLILIGLASILIYAIISQIIFKQQFGDKPMTDMGLVFLTLSVFVIIYLFSSLRLKTKIDSDAINITFLPFVKRRILWQDVVEAKVINYSFVGWGIRLFTKYGTVYNTKGNIGLALKLRNGKKVLIGTQKAQELKTFLKAIR